MELNRIYNEDCLIGMGRIPDKSIDMILCDLPYGTTECEWDNIIPFAPLWNQYRRVIKDNGAVVLTSQQPFTTDLINAARDIFRYEIIWEKSQKLGFLNAKKMPLRSHENILVFYKKLPIYNPQKTIAENLRKSRLKVERIGGVYASHTVATDWIEDGTRYPTSILRVNNWNGGGFTKDATIHPTQKPVKLFEWLINTYTNEGEVVLDNCIGSGTTAIACMNIGRRWVGFESNEKYFKLANARIENHKTKPIQGLISI